MGLECVNCFLWRLLESDLPYDSEEFEQCPTPPYERRYEVPFSGLYSTVDWLTLQPSEVGG